MAVINSSIDKNWGMGKKRSLTRMTMTLKYYQHVIATWPALHTSNLKHFPDFSHTFQHVFLITVHIHERRPYGVTGNVYKGKRRPKRIVPLVSSSLCCELWRSVSL